MVMDLIIWGGGVIGDWLLFKEYGVNFKGRKSIILHLLLPFKAREGDFIVVFVISWFF